MGGGWWHRISFTTGKYDEYLPISPSVHVLSVFFSSAHVKAGTKHGRHHGHRLTPQPPIVLVFTCSHGHRPRPTKAPLYRYAEAAPPRFPSPLPTISRADRPTAAAPGGSEYNGTCRASQPVNSSMSTTCKNTGSKLHKITILWSRTISFELDHSYFLAMG
jgi:hypothetical protein